MLKNNNRQILRHIFTTWTIYSVLYIILAWNKPFHIDEFYSWIYSEKCSFQEILLLRDFGIGHPPLYHLIQKTVQTILPVFHPVFVRLANYFIGSLFIIFLTYVFLSYRNFPVFCYAVAASGTTLDLFIFSRMWGILCLASLLTLYFGEQYSKKPQQKYLYALIAVVFLGFLSDYSFILILPYLSIVFCFRKSSFRYFLFSFFILLSTTWIFLSYVKNIKLGLNFSSISFQIFRDFIKLNYKLIATVFNFWFFETFLFAIFIMITVYSWQKLKTYKNSKMYHDNIPATANRVLEQTKRWCILFFDLSQAKNRIIISIVACMFIILSINPLFWRSLLDKRFLLILYPFLLSLIYCCFDRKLLQTFSIILVVSGGIFIFSSRLSDYYPPPAINDTIQCIYYNEFAYTTQYFWIERDNPKIFYILDFSKFESYCKLCKMGTNEIPFDDFDKFSLIGWSHLDYKELIPSEFFLIHKWDIGLTWLDRIQLKYLTQISTNRNFAIFEYCRPPQKRPFK